MIVNEFESSKTYRLQQIKHTLESVHGVKLELDSKSDDEIRALGESCEIIKNSIVKESAFNTSMQNPEYTKNILILEAIKLYLEEIAPKRMRKKQKQCVKEALSPDRIVKAAEFGRKMIKYSQTNRSTDEKELKILNAISDVGDKLTRIGTPFGPTSLTDIDRQVIEIARRRMTATDVSETAPGEELKLQPGMVKVQKDNNSPAEIIPTKDLEMKQRQGFQPVAEDDELNQLFQKYGIEEEDSMRTARPMNNASPNRELEMLYKKYGVDEAVDQDGDGDNDFADVMIARKRASGMTKSAAIASTKNKSYNRESMMEAKAKKSKLEKLMAKKLDEAAHMESHEDYQADLARSELYRNTKYAMDMLKVIGPDDDVKPWIAASLTKAADILDKIYHHMDYNKTFEDVEPEVSSITSKVPFPPGEEEDMVSGDVGSVARQNLLQIMEYSTKLFRMINPGDKLEGWVAMKLTTASEAISCSKHHLDYSEFEKHVGIPGTDVDSLPVIKEASVANIIMGVMLNEEQDLAQAETLLAAKALSDELQSVAEKLAKMGVDDLMPLVDTMKDQFGQDAANGFNSAVKAALESALNAATDAKESIDNATLSMQQGQVPGMDTDMDTAELPEPGDVPMDDFEATPAASGKPNEPLGRARKNKGLDESKKSKPDFLDVDKDGNKKEPMKKAVRDRAKSKKVDEGMQDLYKGYVDKKGKEVDDLKKVGFTKSGGPKKGPKAEKSREQMVKTSDKMAKAFKKVKESQVKETAPPGKKAEDFIKGAKEDYKKRYGKSWESKLYATAWKKFGPKKESIEKMSAMLESAKDKRASLVKVLETHKAKFARMVNEGIAKDPLKTGYGLEGETILDQISETDTLISKLKEMIKAELNNGIKRISVSENARKRAERLAESKRKSPFGILWKDNANKKHQKFFESNDLRSLWIDLNQNVIVEHKLVNPVDFDKKIASLTAKKG